MDADPRYYDIHYWHPRRHAGGQAGRPAARRYGFPTIPGLLDAARRPFARAGARHALVHRFGNHDGLVQGNFPATRAARRRRDRDVKVISPPAGVSPADMLDGRGQRPRQVLGSRWPTRRTSGR